MTIETHTISDVAENRNYQVIVDVAADGIIVRSVDNDEVYIGVEICDGVLRAMLGPNAEILDVDREGIIAGETINPTLAELAEPRLGPCGCTDYHMADCPIRTG